MCRGQRSANRDVLVVDQEEVRIALSDWEADLAVVYTFRLDEMEEVQVVECRSRLEAS